MVKPIYHLQPETGWMNDPNGPVFIDGKLHMFYQHNPFGASWGNMTWGHAVSPDMVFWKRLPHALKPDKDYDKDGVFSGCCVLRKGLPHIIYTGVRPEVVCLAIGNADASEFTKYEGNPILKGGYRYGWRDPYVLPNPNGGYLMLIGAGDNQGGFVEVYKSKDLISWTKDGDLTDCIGLDLHDEMWECPVMAVMQTNSSKIKGKDAVLFVSAVPDITVRAILGTFDGHKLLPLTNAIRMADLGDCVYAPNLVRHPDGRWIMYGWQRECGEEKDRAAQGWQGMLTLPREVSVKDGEL
ncbi:MAG: glycoside hydrolase family 32 protein, partial [Clostridiales bacterium]|nr:glycoside hydrolase family 32 protein [Clostridiales bacterium]